MMASRLSKGGDSSRDFVSSSDYLNQSGHLENGKSEQKHISFNSPSLDDESGIIAATSDQHPAEDAIPDQHPSSQNQPRTTPRSEAAVEDGRKFLAAFREKRRRNHVASNIGNNKTNNKTNKNSNDSTQHVFPPTGDISRVSSLVLVADRASTVNKRYSIDLLDAPADLTETLAEGHENHQPRGAGLAKSLESTLDASKGGHNTKAEKVGMMGTQNREDGATAGYDVTINSSNNDGNNNNNNTSISHTNVHRKDDTLVSKSDHRRQDQESTINSSRSSSGMPTVTVVDSSIGEIRPDNGSKGELGDMRWSDSTGTGGASEASPSKKNDGDTAVVIDSSPGRPTPEMVRQATRTSQAAFLSTVLPVQDLAVENNGYVNNPLSPPITPNSEYWSSKIHPISSYSGREPSSPPLSHGSVTTAADLSTLNNSSSSPIGSAEDKEALGRWASLQRLQDQSSGLGGAAEHQLSRALELCRGLQGLKTRAGVSPALTGQEQASWLDALQSSLHGLEEVLSKRSLTDRAVRREVDALGGPAVVETMLLAEGGDGDSTQVSLRGRSTSSRGKAAVETSSLMEKGGEGKGGGLRPTGWLSGTQLKAFERRVQARSSLEIAALESERRKLRSKVEMFQRQVKFLQIQGTGGHFPSVATPAIISPASGSLGSVGDSQRFTDLLDARLGEERYLQATLQAEVDSLRRTLEEKDGLVDALREALGSTAGLEPRAVDDGDDGSRTAAIDSAAFPNRENNVAENNASSFVNSTMNNGQSVPGRGVFARSDGRQSSRSRYHQRSSHLLGARGPLANNAVKGVILTAANGAVRRDGGAAPHRQPLNGIKPRTLDPKGNESSKIVEEAGLRSIESESASLLRRESEGEKATGASPLEDLSVEASSSVHAPGSEAIGIRGGDDGAFAAAVAGSAEIHCLSASPGPFPDDDATWEVATETGDGGDGNEAMSRTTATTRNTARLLWDSSRAMQLWGATRVMRSKVGLDSGGSETLADRRRGDKSSHAVLIL